MSHHVVLYGSLANITPEREREQLPSSRYMYHQNIIKMTIHIYTLNYSSIPIISCHWSVAQLPSCPSFRSVVWLPRRWRNYSSPWVASQSPAYRSYADENEEILWVTAVGWLVGWLLDWLGWWLWKIKTSKNLHFFAVSWCSTLLL